MGSQKPDLHDKEAEEKEAKENAAKTAIEDFGKHAFDSRTTKPVKEKACFEDVPKKPGVYWIETTMPVEEILVAIDKLIEQEQEQEQEQGKQKRIRTAKNGHPPIIKQEDGGLYVIYVGTEDNLQRRLKQHLFNEGGKGTARLGCRIHEAPFNQYQWQISYTEIKTEYLRYAVESWWRSKQWPVFCLR